MLLVLRLLPEPKGLLSKKVRLLMEICVWTANDLAGSDNVIDHATK
jgi:hypothetical protein